MWVCFVTQTFVRHPRRICTYSETQLLLPFGGGSPNNMYIFWRIGFTQLLLQSLNFRFFLESPTYPPPKIIFPAFGEVRNRRNSMSCVDSTKKYFKEDVFSSEKNFRVFFTQLLLQKMTQKIQTCTQCLWEKIWKKSCKKQPNLVGPKTEQFCFLCGVDAAHWVTSIPHIAEGGNVFSTKMEIRFLFRKKTP